MSPKDDRWGVHAFGSGDKRLRHFSIFGDRTPLLQRRGQRAEGGKRVQVSRLTEGARAGWPAECTRECACACLCMGAFDVNLVNSLYYSYTHRNKNVARGGGREVQEGQDTRTPMANSC